jgi:hypothetical protein
VAEDEALLSFSPQPNTRNIFIEGHGMNKHGLFKVSGVGERNEDQDFTYNVKLSKAYIMFMIQVVESSFDQWSAA